MKTHAIRLAKPGGPSAMTWQEVDLPAPKKGEVQVKHTAVGLNYIDVYHRSGLYPLPMPSGLGLEAAGQVTALGKGVTGLKVGDRVCYGTGPLGAYAQARNMPAEKLVKTPASIGDEQAAAMMLQGLTVQYLIRQTYRVKKGDHVLLHAAAGGIGLIASQWLRHLGAIVIGTVGSKEKANLAKAHGCHHIIMSREEDIAAKVRKITKGKGVPVVYDGVGKDTFAASLDSLAPLGLLVSFGNASGPVPPFEPGILSAKGSLFFTRPTLMSYAGTREALVKMSRELFQVVGAGAVKIPVNQRYPLRKVAEAHRDLEARKTTGSTVLLP